MREINKILVIGGQGVLGRPVVRRLVKEGFTVRALARNTIRAARLLPAGVDIVEGDLKDIGGIREAASGVDAIYLNLATYDHQAEFKPELDGTRHVIQALEDQPHVLIAKISALGTGPHRSWPDSYQKFLAEEAVKYSGHPYILFQPTSFMESLPLFIRYRWLLYFGRQRLPRYWIAGDDFARQVATAFRRIDCRNRTFIVQGCRAMTLREASLHFVRRYDPRIRVVSLPYWPLRIAVLFGMARADVVKVMKYTDSTAEELQGRETWRALGMPRMTIEDYVDYVRQTGDLPIKQPG